MLVQDLQTLPYRDAWAIQEQVHAEVAEGGVERLLLVEHPPVVTLGRRPNVTKNLVASEEHLRSVGVELVQSDRGGDVTFHGPGQLVAYPILRLNDRHLSVGGYVRRLLETVIATLRDFNIESHIDPTAIGVWVQHNHQPAKICALGVRIRRGVSMHGIALNVTTDLSYFNLIVPCGLARPVTSLQQLLGASAPTIAQVKQVMAHHVQETFQITPSTLGKPLEEHKL